MIFETGKVVKYELKKPTKSQDMLLYDYLYNMYTTNLYMRYSTLPPPKSDEMSLRKDIKNLIRTGRANHRWIMIDDKIIGLYLGFPDPGYGAYRIITIFLEKEYRGLGIGTDIIKKDIEHAKKLKMDVWVGVFKENRSAVNLYKRLGFEIYDGTADSHFMILRIK